jgi:hypothetical protein
MFSQVRRQIEIQVRRMLLPSSHRTSFLRLDFMSIKTGYALVERWSSRQ